MVDAEGDGGRWWWSSQHSYSVATVVTLLGQHVDVTCACLDQTPDDAAPFTADDGDLPDQPSAQARRQSQQPSGARGRVPRTRWHSSAQAGLSSRQQRMLVRRAEWKHVFLIGPRFRLTIRSAWPQARHSDFRVNKDTVQIRHAARQALSNRGNWLSGGSMFHANHWAQQVWMEPRGSQARGLQWGTAQHQGHNGPGELGSGGGGRRGLASRRRRGDDGRRRSLRNAQHQRRGVGPPAGGRRRRHTGTGTRRAELRGWGDEVTANCWRASAGGPGRVERTGTRM